MLRIRLTALFLALAVFSTQRSSADAVADLSKNSVFPSVDLSSLAGGKVLTARGPALSFPRDLTVQAVYVVRAPVARALEMHKSWDAAKHPELKIFLHHDFSTHPTLADFTLTVPDNGAVRKLDAATQKLPNMDDLQLSKAEAAAYKGSANDFWSQLLYRRASAFLSGGFSGQPAYDGPDGSARAGDEAHRLLGEQPKVRAFFRPIIDKSPLGGGSGSLALAPYWEVFNADNEAAYNLGASCSLQTGDSAQYLDLQYYASGGYYAYITLYQLWPVTINGSAATLVWRVDALSTLSIADLGPFDRMGSGAAMSKEIQRIVTYFLKDIGR